MTSETNDATTANDGTETAAEKAAPTKAAKKKVAQNKTPKSTKARKTTKPKAKADEKREWNDTAMVGETLVTLARRGSKAKEARAVSSLASKLAKSTLSHGDLVKLRDAVNELASALREANQKALAREIAVANRGVRRLERAERKSTKKGR
jgi:hypothetical protein